PAAPQIAVDVAAQAVGRAVWLGGEEGAAVGELVVVDVVDTDHARRHAGLDDVELLLVGREGEPVRPVDVAGRYRCSPRLWIYALHVRGQLGRRHVALVVAEDAERRIGEPYRIVGFDHDVVGRIERLAVELVDQHGDAAVVLGARHAPGVVLAGDEPALPVAGIAVGIVRRPAINARASRRLVPAHDAIVGNVAPEHAARISEIDRSLAPARAGGGPPHARQRQTIFGKARIENPDRRVGIALARLPTAERGAGECCRRGRAGGGGEIASREFHGGASHAWPRSLRIAWASS